VSRRVPREPDPTPPPAALDASQADTTSHATPNPIEEAFYSAVLRRILHTLAILTIVLLPFAVLRYGWLAAAGFAAGGFVSWLNFRSLARGAQGLADRIVNLHSRERGAIVVSRFLLRYVLVGGIAYGIFISSPMAFRGFLWGLTLPVGGMLAEAAYEGWTAFRRAG
jgi:hypothetical protein